jgi:hypothetical protein
MGPKEMFGGIHQDRASRTFPWEQSRLTDSERLETGPSIISFFVLDTVFLSVCLSSIILSPLNGPVKMSPYEPGDISLEPERVATSGCDFILH